MTKNKTARCRDMIKEKKKMAAWVAKGKKKPTAKDYEGIIKIQERIIKAREHTFKIYDGMIAHIAEQFELESSRMEKEIEAAMKDRNEAIRRYNALHQLGQMAKDCGVDLSAKLPEHEKNKWKDFKFDINARVLESGQTKFTATVKKKK